jgi:hypothetical protein
MTHSEARRIAREFHADYIATNRQWAICSLESYLPPNTRLYNVEDGDFFPATVEHIALVLRDHAGPGVPK